MNIVLVHIGHELPPYFWTCVDQIRRHFAGPVYVAISARIACARADVRVCPLESLPGDAVKRYAERSFLGIYGEFWNRTFERLFVLEEVMAAFDLRQVIHIENDVLIYSDPDRLPFDRLPQDKVYANPMAARYTMYAYAYVPTHDCLHELNGHNLRILAEGKDVLLGRYGEGMVNEMIVAAELTQQRILGSLPVLPAGAGSENFAVFDSLFDGSSWGQFVGGIHDGTPGWREPNRYVGEELLANRYDVIWQTEPSGKIPFARHSSSGRAYRLNNLHIHSKQLEKYAG